MKAASLFIAALLIWAEEVFSALSRTANALLLGDGAVTLSARSWDGARHGSRAWGWVAAAIDLALRWREHDHCRRAWEWHVEHRLLKG